MDFEEASLQAGRILSQKTEGPNGVIAYAVVNDSRTREGTDQKGKTYTYDEPYFNPDLHQRPQLAYAFCETDRVGIPVVSAPGGTQDVIATNPTTGESMIIELTKDKSLKAALAAIGEAAPNVRNTDALERHTLAKMLEKGWDVKIEDSFTAAVRETKEEQGLNLSSPASYIGAPMQFNRAAITKRTLQDLEQVHGSKLFDLNGVSDLEGVKKIVDQIKSHVPSGTPQMLFAVHVPDFSNVIPINSGDKIESKIKGREGALYREQGQFVTLAQMEEQLLKALPLAQQEEGKGNSFARQEIVATYERLNMFKRIEAALVSQLQKQGVNVSSNTPLVLADTADRLVTEHEGQATMPDDIQIRTVKKAVGGAGHAQ